MMYSVIFTKEYHNPFLQSPIAKMDALKTDKGVETELLKLL
jgi:hypothetical protein